MIFEATEVTAAEPLGTREAGVPSSYFQLHWSSLELFFVLV